MTTGAPTVGSRIGDRYVLEDVIGHGGMAVVYRAWDESLERRVAVKFVRPDHFGPDGLVDRLRVEARNQAELHHENIAPVFDAGEEQGSAYIVLRLVEGGTLHDWLQAQSDASLAHRLALLRQIAAGLDHAHWAGVLHRDIKPSNVLMHGGADGSLRAVISDFGLALRIDRATAERLTAPGSQLGTPSYTAPELWQAGDATPASDIYAFGCLGYEIFAGRPPFTGTAEQVMHGHLTRIADPPSRYRPECHGAIDETIAALLSKDPSLRPATAAAALDKIASQSVRMTKVGRRAGFGAAEDSTPLLWLTAAHALVYVGVFGVAFAVGRGAGAPGTWAALAVVAITVTLALYMRERAPRGRSPVTTLRLEDAHVLEGASGPPPTETIAPQALLPGERQLPPGS